MDEEIGRPFEPNAGNKELLRKIKMRTGYEVEEGEEMPELYSEIERAAEDLRWEQPAVEFTIRASRWTKGNLWFPARLTLSGRTVLYKKGGVFKRVETSIPLTLIDNLSLITGVMYGALLLELENDSEIYVNGLRKKDAKHFKGLLDKMREEE